MNRNEYKKYKKHRDKVFGRNQYKTTQQVLKEVAEVIGEEHNAKQGEIFNIKVTKLSNWRIITYPTGLRQKQMYVKVEALGFAPTKFNVTEELGERLCIRNWGDA